MFTKLASRRKLLSLAGLFGGTALAAACGPTPTAAPAATEEPTATTAAVAAPTVGAEVQAT